MANRNRNAGHAWERAVRTDFINIGFENALTSRYASREMDDLKVDLVNTDPYYIQCKTSSKKLNYLKLLDEMPDTTMSEDGSNRHETKIKVVLDKITRKSGNRFITQGKLAIMGYDDFLDIAMLNRIHIDLIQSFQTEIERLGGNIDDIIN